MCKNIVSIGFHRTSCKNIVFSTVFIEDSRRDTGAAGPAWKKLQKHCFHYGGEKVSVANKLSKMTPDPTACPFVRRPTCLPCLSGLGSAWRNSARLGSARLVSGSGLAWVGSAQLPPSTPPGFFRHVPENLGFPPTAIFIVKWDTPDKNKTTKTQT